MRSSIIRNALLGLAMMLPATVWAKDDAASLYDDLGGQAVLESVISNMLDLSLADPKMAPIFADSDMDRLESLLNLHLCHIADGPCTYDGQDMRRAHDGLGIRTMHFNRLVEYMQTAMDAQDIPFRTQNRLLARLAPMHDDVTERSPVPPRTKKPSSYSEFPQSTPTKAPTE